MQQLKSQIAQAPTGGPVALELSEQMQQLDAQYSQAVIPLNTQLESLHNNIVTRSNGKQVTVHVHPAVSDMSASEQQQFNTSSSSSSSSSTSESSDSSSADGAIRQMNIEVRTPPADTSPPLTPCPGSISSPSSHLEET